MGKILRLHLLDMSLSNCWTQGCKAIFISSINLCFCSQQQSHTIWKLKKNTDRCNKNKWLKLPEVKATKGATATSLFYYTLHTSANWASGSSLQERGENDSLGAPPPSCKKGLGWVLLGSKHIPSAGNSHSAKSRHSGELESFSSPQTQLSLTSSHVHIWNTTATGEMLTSYTHINRLPTPGWGQFEMGLQWQTR